VFIVFGVAAIVLTASKQKGSGRRQQHRRPCHQSPQIRRSACLKLAKNTDVAADGTQKSCDFPSKADISVTFSSDGIAVVGRMGVQHY